MLFSKSPVAYLFLALYFCLSLRILSFSDNLIVLWVLIELQIVVYVTISFPYFRSFHSSLILYFLVQSVSSLMVLACCFFSYWLLFLSFLLKLGGFPFYGWYIASLGSFPNYPLFLALTFQKLGSVTLLGLFLGSFSCYILNVFLAFSLLGGLSSIYALSRLRMLLVWSSLVTNVWFILSLSLSLACFTLYFIVYSFMTLLALGVFGTSYSHIYSPSGFLLLMFGLAGFPPSPLFFVKVLVLYLVAFYSVSMVMLLLVSSVVVMYIYCSLGISSFISQFKGV